LSIPPKQRELQSYVDHYGRESPGFLHYSEFKEIYMTHVHKPGAQPPEEAKLLALFNLFDVQSRGKIARQDFEMCIQRARPAISLVERIGNKVRKGGDRLIRVLTEEFQEADAPFGCNGFLPLNNFQIILADYDLPLVQADLTDLEKRGYLRTDDTGNRYIDYNSILKSVGSKSQSSAGQLAAILKAVVKL
jgi:Ca2+-binding EF-hand superfamily protein